MWLNKGYELEDKLHSTLKSTYGANVFREKELTKLYGWMASSVDFLVETQDNLVFIQVKYLSTRRKESVKVQKFISSIQHISQYLPQRLLDKQITGLWVCKLLPFNDNQELLHTYNVRVVSCFDCMETLIRNTLKSISLTDVR